MSPPERLYSQAYLRYVLGMVFLVSVFNTMDRTVVSVLMERIKSDLVLSDLQLGLIAGPSFAIVHFACGIPIARLADRASRRTIISVGLLVWSLMTAGTGLAQNFVQLMIARMGVGIGEAAGSPPSASLLSDYHPPERRTVAMSMLTIGALAGLGLGLVAGGWAGERWGWRTALVILGLPGVALALLFRFSVAEPPRGYSEPDGYVAPTETQPLLFVCRYLIAIPAFRWVVAGACVAGIASMGKNLWEPTFLIRSYHMSPSETGLTYFLISALPSAIGAWVGARNADRLSTRDVRYPLWLCAFGNALVFPLSAAFLLWPSDQLIGGVPVAFFFSVASSLAGGMFSPIVIAIAQNLARPSMRALAHALWTMVFSLLGMGVGPALVGALSSHWETSYGSDSLRYALLLVAFTIVPSAYCFVRGARTLAVDLAAARA